MADGFLSAGDGLQLFSSLTYVRRLATA